VERLRYLDHGEALLFVIDPFALPELRLALPDSERRLVEEVTPTSDEDPSDTLQRLLAELRSRDDQGRQRRIAVVVTKADVLRRTSAGRDLDAGVREWLDGLGLGNTTRTLERTAAQVRYFASGLDSPPAALADLFGWAAGLTLNGGPEQAPEPAPDAEAAGDDPVFDDRPTADEMRAPWPISRRSAGLIPLGHRIGRLSLFEALAVLGPAVTAVFGLGVYAWFR
jgi:Double-GTPase 2